MRLVEQVHEQLVGLVDDLGDPRVGAVDLVHHEDHRHVAVQRLAEHEPGLRQRASEASTSSTMPSTIDRPRSTSLSEVGAAGGVDDVDDHLLALGRRALVVHGGVLGEDRDALLALELTGVHGALVDVLVLAESAGLVQHRVHQGRLAVVDVRHGWRRS